MNLFKRYIKSATFNNPISQKNFRIVQLIFFSIWIICFIPVLIMVIQGIVSIPLYFKSIALKEKYQTELTSNRQQKEQLETKQTIIKQSKNKPETGLDQFVKQINKNTHTKGLTVSKGYQDSESVPNTVSTSYFNLQPWREVGINDPDPYNDNMPNEAISINSDKIFSGVISLIAYTLVFLVPWILIRCVFWIKTADTKPVSN